MVCFFIVPINYIFAYGSLNNDRDAVFRNDIIFFQETDNVEIIDSGRLIPFYDCPYDFTFYIEDNYTKVEVQHYGEDGSLHKFGGWKAWLEVNGSTVYEWDRFDEGTGSYWYDYIADTYYYDNEPPTDFTDITDLVSSGDNLMTFFHNTEGSGTGIKVKVYYGSTTESSEESDDSSGESAVSESDTRDSTEDSSIIEDSEEKSDFSTLLEEEKASSGENEQFTTITEEDKEKLVFDFKTNFVNPDNPGNVLGSEIPGLTEGNLRDYKRTILYEKLFTPYDYITAATSWEDVARLAMIESKVHYTFAQNLGYFKSLYNVLSVFYLAQSFRESLRDIPKQFNSLRSVGSAKDLVKHKDTIIGLSSNLTGIYDEAIGLDRQGAAELGFPALDSSVMFFIGAVSSGGWSVLGDISKGLFIENAQYSINYEMKKALLNSSLAYHAQVLHELAIKQKITAEEVNEFFFHSRRIVVLKQLDMLLNMEDSISLWQENPDLMTRALGFLNVINARQALEADLYLYEEILTNYENAENFIQAVASDIGVEWQY